MHEVTMTPEAPATASATRQPKAPKGQSTKPGEPAPKAKKEKKKRIDYPGLNVDAEGKATTKLSDYPADFDPAVHKQLKRHHFENEAPLLEKRAADLQKRVDQLKQEALDARAMGSKETRGKVKKLRSVMERFAELKKELIADGVPTDQFDKMFAAAMTGEQAKEPVAESAPVTSA